MEKRIKIKPDGKLRVSTNLINVIHTMIYFVLHSVEIAHGDCRANVPC